MLNDLQGTHEIHELEQFGYLKAPNDLFSKSRIRDYDSRNIYYINPVSFQLVTIEVPKNAGADYSRDFSAKEKRELADFVGRDIIGFFTIKAK
jgi:hypothetical protein